MGILSSGIRNIGESGRLTTDQQDLQQPCKTMWGILNAQGQPTLAFQSQVYNMLKVSIMSHGLEASITTYVIHLANRDQLAQDNRWLHTLLNQALMVLSYAGLQALRLSYKYYEADNSAVWTNRAAAEQGERVQAAWESLLHVGDLHPFARLLGYSHQEWESSNYPDVLWCAKKSGLNKNELSLTEFAATKQTKVSIDNLEELMKQNQV